MPKEETLSPICPKCGTDVLGEQSMHVELDCRVVSWETKATNYVRYSDGPPIPTAYLTNLGATPIRITIVCKCGHKRNAPRGLFHIDWRC